MGKLEAGQVCASAGSSACDSTGQLLDCQTNGAGCPKWVTIACAGGLTCGAVTDGGAACLCPEPDGGWLFADPDAGSPVTAVPRPTGALSPPQCRFSTLGAALENAPDGGSVVAIGTPNNVYARWRPSTAYLPGAPATPSVPNGSYYEVLSAAPDAGRLSGDTEPNWPLDGGDTVRDGDLTWKNAGLVSPVIFGWEKFPITIPPNVTLVAANCLSAADAGSCDTRQYYIDLSSSVASDAIVMGSRSELTGFFLPAALEGFTDGGSAWNAIHCGPASIALLQDTVVLEIPATSKTNFWGVSTSAGCGVDIWNSAFGGGTGALYVVGSDPNTVTIQDSTFAGSRSDSVVIHATSSLDFEGNFIAGAGGRGLYLEGDLGPIDGYVVGNEIIENASSAIQVDGSGAFRDAGNTSTIAHPIAVSFEANVILDDGRTSGSEVEFTGVPVYPDGGNDTVDHWVFGPGSAACTNSSVGVPNVIACYAARDAGITLGVTASAGAMVDAQGNYWENAKPISGTDYSSNVDAAGSCGDAGLAAYCPVVP